eukprot:993853-Alexandrium_andersonii.AAC.1
MSCTRLSRSFVFRAIGDPNHTLPAMLTRKHPESLATRNPCCTRRVGMSHRVKRAGVLPSRRPHRG